MRFCLSLGFFLVQLSGFSELAAQGQVPQNSLANDFEDSLHIGWPLGVQRTCSAKTDSLRRALALTAENLRKYCNNQNEEMRRNGFFACGENECLDSLVRLSGHVDRGRLDFRLEADPWTGEPIVTLLYTYPGTVSATTPKPTVVCSDPMAQAQQALDDQFASWDFRQFAEFCSAQNDK